MDYSFSYIDLSNVRSISRGDSTRVKKYIVQFQELISERLDLLNEALEAKDRVQIRQICHKMIPQLEFFGVKEVRLPISRLELEYETMPMEELHSFVQKIISRLSGALAEVQEFLKNQVD
ncbi:hypothetical protein E4S40_13490 [Algoriphagus kandeliae]|uniref:HPt domain-containing protein n=1 Tax=Algoriphagus kandeliae TaxID=2562278 RepID=A0A4Y9QM41_9BACT|nr:hypothetical protein [Algoriphagus kandeliae]TFV93267.1 hypothetical protein E4S40_13490 [Algoriphagus kandeliae]